MTDDAADQPPAETWLTLTEAAELTGRHRSTIRRAYDAESFPNARMGRTAQRRPQIEIPVSDLRAAGFTVRAPATEPTQPPQPSDATAAELARLREENAELRRRAEVAEARAAERQLHLDSLRISLRMLEPGPAVEGTERPIQRPEAGPGRSGPSTGERPREGLSEHRRRGWWDRLRLRR